jgi:hypothetical protein
VHAVRFDVKNKNSLVVLTSHYDYALRKGYFSFHGYSIDESELALYYQGVVLSEETNNQQKTEEQIYEEDVGDWYEQAGVFYKIFLVQGTERTTSYSDFYLENGTIKPFGLITETSYSRLAGGFYREDGSYIDSDSGNYYYLTYIPKSAPFLWERGGKRTTV